MTTARIALVQQQLQRDSQELTDTMRTTRAEFERRLAKMRESANEFVSRKRSERRASKEGLPTVKP